MLAVILRILLALVGVAAVTSGGFLLGVYGTQRDPSGFFASPDQQVGSYGFALTAPNIDAALGSRWETWLSHRAHVTLRVPGASLPAAPGRQSFWVAKAQGSGTQTLQWRFQLGDWTVVVMNADGSAPAAATMSVGARVGILKPLIIGLTTGGAVLLAITATLMVLSLQHRRLPSTPARSRFP